MRILVTGQQLVRILVKVHVRHKIITGYRKLMKDPFSGDPLRNIHHGQDSRDITAARRLHHTHLDLGIAAYLLVGQLYKILSHLVRIIPFKGCQRRFTAVDTKKIPPFLFIHDQF